MIYDKEIKPRNVLEAKMQFLMNRDLRHIRFTHETKRQYWFKIGAITIGVLKEELDEYEKESV